TAREHSVLELMAQGRTNAGICAELFFSAGAVEKNTTAIFSKLGLEPSGGDHRRVLAVLKYLEHAYPRPAGTSEARAVVPPAAGRISAAARAIRRSLNDMRAFRLVGTGGS